MPVNNTEILKAVAEFTLGDGTIAQNIFHFIANFAGSQTGAAVIAAIKSYIEDFYTSLLTYIPSSTDAELATIHVIEFDDVDNQWETQRLIGNTLPALTFTGGTDPLPNQVSAVVVGNTTRPKSRGRKFILPMLETATLASDIVAAVVTALGTTLNHYLADETVGGSDVLSPGVPRAGVDSFLEFTDGVVNSVVGTQRRRKPNVGA